MRRLPLAAACAALLIASAGCGGGDTTPQAEGTGGASTTSKSTPTKSAEPPPAPKPGECRDLSYADISLYSNETEPTPCDKAHTAYTFSVEELPSDVAFDGVEIQNDAVQDAAADACQQSYISYVGGGTADRALTRLTVTYFVPPQPGFDAGAHWVRCDIVALQSESSLADLPKRLEGFLDKDDAAQDYGVCSRGEPSDGDSSLVMCTQEHTYRAVAALRLGGPHAPYPGEQVVLDGGQQDCEDTIKDLLGVSGGFTYSWTYPSASDWSAGQRYGYCWNESDH